MPLTHNFHTLTIADLLEAREAYHRHLTNLPNVVGTAIGRYFIRESDPDFKNPDAERNAPSDAERRLTNSEIRPWSKPCVLVFVDHWPTLKEMRERPERFVPPCLYLPDGRIVPTCVVLAPRKKQKDRPIHDISFARSLMGGGYPLLSEIQGQSRIGSVGCLVTDGHSVFALSNCHVVGPAGQPAFRVSQGRRHEVGSAVSKSLWAIPFEQAYPEWAGCRTHLNLDAGLLRVNDIDEWTAQVYGIGEMGELTNVDEDTLSLDILGRDVEAFGAVTGPLSGTIKALFYRYRSLAGFDYVADFLIGPSDPKGTVTTQEGDSGTIWFLEALEGVDKARPLAMQWGSVSFGEGASEQGAEFVLASNLTVICRELGVRIVTDWETGLPETWGKLGHYQIAAKACDVVANNKLRKLMSANRERIGLSDDDLIHKRFPKNLQEGFIALADVPDLWWRDKRKNRERAAHFADMDEPGKNGFAGKTLMGMYDSDPATLNPKTWKSFYESLGKTKMNQGLLPFKVKQIYEAMVKYAKEKKVAEFVAAAGVMSHYVADAAISLHLSQYYDGRDASERGVHSRYENSMLEKFRAEIVAEINRRLKDREIKSQFKGAQRAAEVCVELAAYTMDRLAPLTIIEAFNNSKSKPNRNDSMWEDLGDATIDCMEQGTLYLAELWESAWVEGGGNKIPSASLKEISTSKLRTLYKRKSYLKAKWLEEM